MFTRGYNIQNVMELRKNNNNDQNFSECIVRAIANIAMLKNYKNDNIDGNFDDHDCL